ncbi:MAG: nitrile hydratase accessory protein [Rhodospirillaceae bacterium]|nr:nitrile hydratase accessory protein [Rhodospirillaceae bacterium]
MQTRFEHFATSSMLCAEDAPPRRNGSLHFERPWEGRAFAMALALSKQGHFEWEAFRQNLIKAIGEWEAANPDTNEGWDYYERWLLALERIVLESALIDERELTARLDAAEEPPAHTATP